MTEVIQMCGNMHSEASEPYKQYIFSRFNLQSVISFIFLSYPSMPQQRHSERYAVLFGKAYAIRRRHMRKILRRRAQSTHDYLLLRQLGGKGIIA